MNVAFLGDLGWKNLREPELEVRSFIILCKCRSKAARVYRKMDG